MPAMPAAPAMTAEEFLALPYQESAAIRELVAGELLVNEPTMAHNRVQRNLLEALLTWTRAADERGEVFLPADVRLDERNVFVPDLLWYRVDNVPDVHSPPPYPTPDLGIEIRSPSTWARDLGIKKATYERHGLPELWLVDTAAEDVLVFRRSRPEIGRFDVELELTRRGSLASPLLPGFDLPLGTLFDLS
jgi:Uma2 family endonuclease